MVDINTLSMCRKRGWKSVCVWCKSVIFMVLKCVVVLYILCSVFWESYSFVKYIAKRHLLLLDIQNYFLKRIMSDRWKKTNTITIKKTWLNRPINTSIHTAQHHHQNRYESNNDYIQSSFVELYTHLNSISQWVHILIY